ncbi:MAG TPA: BadF/BadG/BcrA/BcrD ATPase family protein [Thermoanaerobaculia bacterium]|nr:BadF/BadG/BcrA/BcrD ATPase family protein [Thermoanaerobaculia bacterium]
MRCVVGIDLGSTTTKALLLTEEGEVLGRGITNSRSSYDVACAVAREEALTAARFHLLERHLAALPAAAGQRTDLETRLKEAFRLELYLDHLGQLREEIDQLLAAPHQREWRDLLSGAVAEILGQAEAGASELFAGPGSRKSDFFRDLAGAAFVEEAERIAAAGKVPFERLLALYDRAILAVETRLQARSFSDLLRRAAARVRRGSGGRLDLDRRLTQVVEAVAAEPIEELTFVGTGYGRQTLPFPKESVRSEILCHGRGAHRFFPGTRTVLDIGGQDTKAIQVDATGVVTSFQMNDRCAAGSGRYLGYLADELNLGLHELGPLALQAQRQVRVSSTCTVFAGAELRERLALGEAREDVLAGLHRAMMLRAVSLLARSGGVFDQFTFTGGVARNPMAVKVLRELVAENYGDGVGINIHTDSIYMGAMGAALFALEDLAAGKGGVLPTFAQEATA